MANTKNTVLRLYRTLLKRAVLLRDGIELREPLHRPWGYYESCSAGADYINDVASTVLPKPAVALLEKSVPLDNAKGAHWFTPSVYREIVRESFKLGKHASSPEDQSRYLDMAFEGLRALLGQCYLQGCSSSRTTDGVRIDVTSKFDRAMTILVTGEVQYVFTYRVRITNERTQPIKVLGRSWTFQDADENVCAHIVLNPNNAIVGQQPTILPGESWQYYSGTNLPTPSGCGYGTLLVQLKDHASDNPQPLLVSAEIAPFQLAMPAGVASK